MRHINLWAVFPMTLLASSFYQEFHLRPSLAQPAPNLPGVEIKQTRSTLLSRAYYLSQLEKEVIIETNKVRKNPQSYIPIMEEYKNRFQEKRVKVGDRKYMLTKEGVTAVDEANQFLKSVRPVGELNSSAGMSLAARDLVNDQGPKGTFGHHGSDKSDPSVRINRYGKWQVSAGENIAYGSETAQGIVMQLIIDDGVPNRGHRKNLFNPNFKIAGAAYGRHSVYKTMCVIDYASSYQEQ
ncbi:MAG: CAP domain-containing protein [Rhizonema sp. NSF051]|nr:CAP domain-containing protein [Rhizonema sp. NSF051]